MVWANGPTCDLDAAVRDYRGATLPRSDSFAATLFRGFEKSAPDPEEKAIAAERPTP